MDKLETYRHHIKNIISEYGSHKVKHPLVEREQVIDEKNDHYEVLSVGWNGSDRIHNSVVHIDIRNGKIWIQRDNTEEGVANRFVEWGVPKQDIVLAFHSPYMRKLGEFAVE